MEQDVSGEEETKSSKLKNVTHTRRKKKKKKDTNSIYTGPKFVEFIPEAVCKSYQSFGERFCFVMKALPRSLTMQHSQDGSIWTMVLEKKFADGAICNL